MTKRDSHQSVRGAANHQANPALGTRTGGQNQQQSNLNPTLLYKAF
jgi:hypothetical protein